MGRHIRHPSGTALLATRLATGPSRTKGDLMRYRLRHLVALAASVVLAACGSNSTEPTSYPLAVSLDGPSSVLSGEQAEFTLTLTNVTGAPLTSESPIPCDQSFAIEISDAGGTTVWRSYVGIFGDGCITPMRVEPGASYTTPIFWDGRDQDDVPVPGGTYRIRAGAHDGGRFVVLDPNTYTIVVQERAG
jgi:hypothetical protein